MALFNCPECGKEISDQAEVCPHCGYPIRLTFAKKEPRGRGFGIAGLVLGIIGVTYCYTDLVSLIARPAYFKMQGNDYVFGILFALIGILSLAFGIIARKLGHRMAKSGAAIVLGSITMAMSVAIILLSLLK